MNIFCHRQHFSVEVSGYKFAMKIYGVNTNFDYLCTVNLTFEIWPWVNVMRRPWVMDNKNVKDCICTYFSGNIAESSVLIHEFLTSMNKQIC